MSIMHKHIMNLFLTSSFLVFLIACTSLTTAETHLVPNNDLPFLTDDLEFIGLIPALDRQISAFKNEPYKHKIQLGNDVYSFSKVEKSVREFRSLVESTSKCLSRSISLTYSQDCKRNFNAELKSKFHFYKASGNSNHGSSYFTAYYTPTIEVAEQQDKDHPYPIYKTPPVYLRHYNRREIDFEEKLKGKGYELFYAKNLFDIYVLHVEGGGKVEVIAKDGHRYSTYLIYKTDNGKPFTHIEDYMISSGMLTPSKRSRRDQQKYLSRHPDEVEEILSSCAGYVFFSISSKPPIGSTGAQLTPNRSIATDPNYYPVRGLIAYITASIPILPKDGNPLDANRRSYKKQKMHRFFIDQDIGHSITGPARADIYFGEGKNATFQANNLSTYGEMYFLILK